MLKEMMLTCDLEITFKKLENKTIYYIIRLNGCCYLVKFRLNKTEIKLIDIEKREFIAQYTPFGDITLNEIIKNSEELEEIIGKKWLVRFFQKWGSIK